jgi:threonine dehydrogenase-like Zn-dependent dehydrogenase
MKALTMISRKLTRRLEELEARTAPAAEPVIVEVMYVSTDGTEEVEYRVEMPTSTGPAWLRRLGGTV